MHLGSQIGVDALQELAAAGGVGRRRAENDGWPQNDVVPARQGHQRDSGTRNSFGPCLAAFAS